MELSNLTRIFINEFSDFLIEIVSDNANGLLKNTPNLSKSLNLTTYLFDNSEVPSDSHFVRDVGLYIVSNSNGETAKSPLVSDMDTSVVSDVFPALKRGTILFPTPIECLNDISKLSSGTAFNIFEKSTSNVHYKNDIHVMLTQCNLIPNYPHAIVRSYGKDNYIDLPCNNGVKLDWEFTFIALINKKSS